MQDELEPVAWLYEVLGDDCGMAVWTPTLSCEIDPPKASNHIRNVRPLYEARPTPQPGSGLVEKLGRLCIKHGSIELSNMGEELAWRNRGTEAWEALTAPAPDVTDAIEDIASIDRAWVDAHGGGDATIDAIIGHAKAALSAQSKPEPRPALNDAPDAPDGVTAAMVDLCEEVQEAINDCRDADNAEMEALLHSVQAALSQKLETAPGVREAVIEAIREERLVEPQGESDQAYMRGLKDAEIAAIRALAAQDGSTT